MSTASREIDRLTSPLAEEAEDHEATDPFIDHDPAPRASV
jgi:hypothetical protein